MMKIKPSPTPPPKICDPEVVEFPKRVTLELTNQCNLSCVMCPRKYMKGPKGYLSFSLFKKVIDEISDHKGISLVPFFRGESLFHPDCLKMLAYIKKSGVRPIQFTTNATLMTNEVARSIIDLELDFVSFSVDSIDPETYAKIRKGADFDAALKNIEFFCDLKNKMELEKPEIQVSVVKTESTSDGIKNFVRFWKDRADRVRVYEEHSQNGRFGSLNHNTKETSEDRQPCYKPFNDMVIYWNGLVALCNHDWDRANPLGDVKLNTIDEIWHSDAYKRARDAHLGEGELEKLCQACDHWKAFYQKENILGELHVSESEIEAIAG